MDIKRTYSLVDVSKRIGRPRTTLADWARQFEEFLPTVGSGRTTRYTEDALEVFGLISKMKDANEPSEYISEQLRSVVREIVVTIPKSDDEGKPYLMQLSDEVDQLKQLVFMLTERIDKMTTDNDDARREVAVMTEQLTERITDVSENLEVIRKGQLETTAQLSEISSRVETYGKRKRQGLLSWFKR